MIEDKTASEALGQPYWFKRRELIKLQLEKEILKIVREIVNEKIELIEPILDELEALEKMRFDSPSLRTQRKGDA